MSSNKELNSQGEKVSVTSSLFLLELLVERLHQISHNFGCTANSKTA